MNKFYKRFLILIVLVLVISGTVIYTTVDINTLKNLTQFKTWSIALAILAVSLGLFFDGSRLMHLVKISDEKITLYQAVQVVFGNYFLALLTPGATGGAVAQLMFLRHAGVPTGKAAVLDYVASEAPDELHEGIDLSERPDIGPGETVEYVYFWAPKTAYYGPITVEFVDAYAPAKNHEAMHFDTTGCETKEFKAAGGVADSGEKADLTGIDCASYSIEAADGYTLDSSDEEREKANFFHDETGGRLNISIFPRSPEEEVASLEQVYEGKETTTDQVE